MIQLDTSFLTRALVRGSPKDALLREWLRDHMVASVALGRESPLATVDPANFRRLEACGLKAPAARCGDAVSTHPPTADA